MTKTELITALSRGRIEFLGEIKSISQEDLLIPGVVGNWSLKDILVHLTRWEAELVKLLWQAKQGQTPTTIHFSPDSVDEVNERWFLRSQSRPLDVVWDDFTTVREQTIRRVEEFREKELNDPQYYPWLDGTPLWKWVATDTYEHEIEHLEDIHAWQGSKGKST